jgi:hypothetical protein
MLEKVARSVPNLLHLAGRVEHDDTVRDWLTLRHTSLPLVEAGESILRRSIAHVEAVADRLPGLDQTVLRILSTSVSDAVFRCGLQRGFVESQGFTNALPTGDVARDTMLPHADLVRITMAMLIMTGQTDAARTFLDSSARRVAEAGGDQECVTQFIRRATFFRSPPPAQPHRS